MRTNKKAFSGINVKPSWQTFVFAVLGICVTNCAPAWGRVTLSFTEPIEQSNVAAAETGVVTDIQITEGQTVKKGETLAELDNDALKQTLRIAELRAKSNSDLKKAEATLRTRQTRRNTLVTMLNKGHANPTEVDEAVVEYEVAKSDYQLAREKNAEYVLDVDRIKAQIKARTIQSPIDGVISEVHYRLGEYISGSNPQFATVVKLDQLIVRFYLLESEILSLRPGQQVPLNLRVGEKTQRITGTIRFVSPVTDPDSGTARIDVVIDNQNGSYRSGSQCEWIGLKTQKIAGDAPVYGAVSSNE